VVADLPKDYSPAASAGIRSGDVIVEFDGKHVTSPKQLTELVADTPVGKPTQLKYVRDGRAETATIKLGERPPSPGDNDQPDREDPEDDGGKIGVSISDVSVQLAREMKLRIPTGVAISKVTPDSPAADAGLQRGDVIHRINRMPVTNRQDYLRAISSLKGEKELTLQVERGGQLQFVSLTLE
jgi:serine protease Do